MTTKPTDEQVRLVQQKVMAQGGTCLVTCYEGRNRSALVIAEHLIQSGEDPDTVIAQIQKLRHKAIK